MTIKGICFVRTLPYILIELIQNHVYRISQVEVFLKYYSKLFF